MPLSALQHTLFCRRQCALIHIERIWEENRHTAEGRVLHERADRPGHQTRRGVHTAMALPLAHQGMQLTGYADVVEFGGQDDKSTVRPVEYKRGRPKAHRADEVQLCAQALCLEDMLACSIADGDLFYGKTKRRQTVVFDDELRALTATVARETRALIAAGQTPPAVYAREKCDSCSLIESCRPKALSRARSVHDWVSAQLADAG